MWTREWLKSSVVNGEDHYNYSNLKANKKYINFLMGIL